MSASSTLSAASAVHAARRPSAQVVRELARSRSGADRLRARMTTAAAAGIGVVLLMAASAAGIQDTAVNGIYGYADQGGLAPYLARSGLRPGAVMAALLLVLPFGALALQALRVGSLSLRRQAGLLALAGAAPADLRRMRVVRTRAAFARGGLWAAPVYLLVWLVLGVALPPGTRLLPVPQWWMPAAWALVVVILVGVATLLGWRPTREEHGDDGGVEPSALVRVSAAPGRAPSLWWAWGPGLAAVALLLIGGRLLGETPSAVSAIAILALEVVLLAGCTAVLLARRAARPLASGRDGRRRRVPTAWRISGRDAAVAVLARAQRRANPGAAGTVGAVLFVCGLSFGVEVVLSTGLSSSEFGYSRSDLAFYLGGAAVAGAVGVLGVVVAMLALALSLSDHLLATRRSVAATAALGMEPRRLLAVQTRALSGTAVPAVVSGTLVAGLLYSVRYVTVYPERAWVVLASVLLAAALAGLLIAAACRVLARVLSSRVRAAADLENLRTP